jgi:hypothetical protein
VFQLGRLVIQSLVDGDKVLNGRQQAGRQWQLSMAQVDISKDDGQVAVCYAEFRRLDGIIL